MDGTKWGGRSYAVILLSRLKNIFADGRCWHEFPMFCAFRSLFPHQKIGRRIEDGWGRSVFDSSDANIPQVDEHTTKCRPTNVQAHAPEMMMLPTCTEKQKHGPKIPSVQNRDKHFLRKRGLRCFYKTGWDIDSTLWQVGIVGTSFAFPGCLCGESRVVWS